MLLRVWGFTIQWWWFKGVRDWSDEIEASTLTVSDLAVVAMDADVAQGSLETIIMTPPFRSRSLYSTKLLNANIHGIKQNQIYFSIQPRFGYINLNGRKIKMAALWYWSIHVHQCISMWCLLPSCSESRHVFYLVIRNAIKDGVDLTRIFDIHWDWMRVTVTIHPQCILRCEYCKLIHL